MLTKSLCALGLGLVTMVMIMTGGACGSGSNNEGAAGSAGHAAGGSGGGGVDTSAPCYAYCMARETKKDCSPDKTIADCLEYTNGCKAADFAAFSTACQNAYKAYWTCIGGQTDPCDIPGNCATQGEAVGTACN